MIKENLKRVILLRLKMNKISNMVKYRCDYKFWKIDDLKRLDLHFNKLPCKTCLVVALCKQRMKDLNRSYVSLHAVSEFSLECNSLREFILSWEGPFPLSTDNPFLVYTGKFFNLDFER
jgi:hypothetical protein